ncbi:UpxY family transcription antiterminator [Aureisphaera galaxeae]|uniref:UpxY family transcription antiterminator n=1 Tax=Aureisphaera galaxeae TaxID=1538023 RepID=UPI00234FBEAB|nr:UpxY family transcription antiterminator [Aureisphaera galaxeae]MDC8004739.1 UpxY family transcription antiterminator [Aureisphaera galaxeae]
MKPKSTIGWHVVYVRSRFERKVHEAIEEMSIESFLPMVKTVRKWSDRKKVIEKPLFPSYVFVNIRSSMDFYKVLSVNGTCAYIKIGSDYATVREEEINKVKFMVGARDLEDIETKVALPKVGEIKTIYYGPLADLECEVLKVNNQNKIVVRLNSLQQNIVATLPAHYLDESVKAIA